MGGRFAVDDDRTIPDTMEVTFQFASGRMAVFGMHETSGDSMNSTGEIELRGTLGTAFLSTNGYEVIPEKRGQFATPHDMAREEKKIGRNNHHALTALHACDVPDCMATRSRPHADIEIGHRSTTFCQRANISLAVGRRLEWDAGNERFIDDDEANSMLHYKYRSPWKLPS